MKTSHLGILLLTSIAGFAFSGSPTSTLANDIAAPAAQTAPVQNADVSSDLSAQRRFGGGGGFGGGGNVGRMVRPGMGRPNIGRMDGVGRISRVSRIDGIGRVSRVSRIDGIGRVSRISRIDGIGRVNRISRVSRIGRIGVIPVPVPMGPGPGPGPGLGVVAPPCLVCPVQACLIAVYADPNLTGATFETRDNQPRLDQVAPGWQNQISSVMVKGGTWEFYPDLEYRGGPPVLRLAPGSYVVLEPQWTKRISSFMCVR